MTPGPSAPAPRRVARGVPGLDGLINSILVHGEDDFDSPEDSTASA